MLNLAFAVLVERIGIFTFEYVSAQRIHVRVRISSGVLYVFAVRNHVEFEAVAIAVFTHDLYTEQMVARFKVEITYAHVAPLPELLSLSPRVARLDKVILHVFYFVSVEIELVIVLKVIAVYRRNGIPDMHRRILFDAQNGCKLRRRNHRAYRLPAVSVRAVDGRSFHERLPVLKSVRVFNIFAYDYFFKVEIFNVLDNRTHSV